MKTLKEKLLDQKCEKIEVLNVLKEKQEFYVLGTIVALGRIFSILKPVTKILGMSENEVVVFELISNSHKENLRVVTNKNLAEEVLALYKQKIEED